METDEQVSEGEGGTKIVILRTSSCDGMMAYSRMQLVVAIVFGRLPSLCRQTMGMEKRGE